MTKYEKSSINKTRTIPLHTKSNISETKNSFSNNSEVMEHVKSLAFNRNASTTGEIKTIEYIRNQLTNQGIESIIQHFKWLGPNGLIIRIIYIIILSYLLLFRLDLIIIVYVIIKFLSIKARNTSLLNKKESRNIISKITAKKRISKPPLVIFTAHHDSVATKFTFKFQKFINLFLRFVIIPYYLMILIFSLQIYIGVFFDLEVHESYMYFIGISSLIGIGFIIPVILFTFSAKKTKSTGSIDNASGVAILIELIKFLNRTPLENLNIMFLWSGAEEWGMKGSKKFCEEFYEEIAQKYDLNISYNINLDMVGSYIGLVEKSGLFKKKVNRDFNDVLETTAKNLNVPIIRYNSRFAVKSDHKAFNSYFRKRHKNFQVSCFQSIKDSKIIHTVNDSPDKCSKEILNGCLDICYTALKTIDSNLDRINNKV